MKSDIVRINFSEIIDLGTEIWRYKKYLTNNSSNNPMEIRFIRKMEEFLEKNQIIIEDLTDGGYDPGMAVNVIHTEQGEDNGEYFIKETIYPAIYYQNQLIKQAVVTISNIKVGE